MWGPGLHTTSPMLPTSQQALPSPFVDKIFAEKGYWADPLRPTDAHLVMSLLSSSAAFICSSWKYPGASQRGWVLLGRQRASRMVALGTAAPGVLQHQLCQLQIQGKLLLSRKWGSPGPSTCSQENLSRVAPSAPRVDLANSAPTSLSLLLCPTYLEKWEQRKENILSLQRWTNLATHALPGAS